MSTRTSARLAKAKGKRVLPDPDEIQGSDASDGYVNSDQEEQKPPPRKRQRATTKPPKGVARQKQVRGKQGRLAGLVNMPVDIFTEVASHLLPADIITLARSNKFFRNLLMNRSAIHIWHNAMRNVPGLPPCPARLSEPHYLSLLYSKTCSMCGALARINMDPFLLERLCGPCRNAHLMPLSDVPMTLIPLVRCARRIAPSKRGSCSVFVLRQHYEEVLAEYEEKMQPDDDTALKAWIKERLEVLHKEQDEGRTILEFLDAIQWDREQELTDLKSARRSEIKRRLTEMGWTEEDMEFSWWSSNPSQWLELVSQPKPITDRIWTNLQPKLIPLLEKNREERLAMELEERRQDRQLRISKLFLAIKKTSSPFLDLKAPNPVARLTGTIPTITFTHRDPFPDFAHALDWPLIKNLYETDSSEEEVEAELVKNRDQIEALVTEWKDRIQAHFVNLLRAGYENRYEVLRPATITLNHYSDSPPTVSDDLKLLLRADSLFYQTVTDGPNELVSYGAYISAKGLNGIHSTYGSTIPRPGPDLDQVHWYPEAHEVARQLLADMGRPNASYPEMKSVGRVFACGRCHETRGRNWDEMVQHYIEQEQLHAKIQEDISNLTDVETVYNDVHSSTLLTDQPMVTDFASRNMGNGVVTGLSRRQVCKLCEKIPAAGEVVAWRAEILKHLSNVHGISEPKVDEHFAPQPFNTGIFGVYDSDDSYDYSGACSCPFHQMFDDGEHGYGDDDEDEDDW